MTLKARPDLIYNCHKGHAMRKCPRANADSKGQTHPSHPRSFQGLLCPLTESLDTVVCINGEQMPG